LAECGDGDAEWQLQVRRRQADDLEQAVAVVVQGHGQHQIDHFQRPELSLALDLLSAPSPSVDGIDEISIDPLLEHIQLSGDHGCSS